MIRLEMKSYFPSLPPPLNCVLSEKQSLNSSSSGQCMFSGQTEVSQEVFIATPNLLCNRGSY